MDGREINEINENILHPCYGLSHEISECNSNVIKAFNNKKFLCKFNTEEIGSYNLNKLIIGFLGNKAFY